MLHHTEQIMLSHIIWIHELVATGICGLHPQHNVLLATHVQSYWNLHIDNFCITDKFHFALDMCNIEFLDDTISI